MSNKVIVLISCLNFISACNTDLVSVTDKMNCETTYMDKLGNRISRCTNKEAVCYILNSKGIECRFNEDLIKKLNAGS